MDGLFRLASINRIALESMHMRIEHWFLTQVFVLATVEQLVVILVALGIAWLLSRPIERRAQREIVRRSHWLEQSLKLLAFAAVRISFPLLWVALLWAWVLVMRAIGTAAPLVSTAASLITAWVIIRLLSSLVRNDAVARVLALVAWTVAALNILDLLDPIIALLDRASVTLGQVRLSVLGVGKAVLTVTVLFWLANVASRIFEQRLRGIRYIGPSGQVLLAKLVKTGVIAVAILLALNTIGIDLTTLAVFTGAIGVGIGFGLQKVVSNLVSGTILLLDRSIKPGDVIQLGDTFGWVSKLGARYVAVTTRDGVDWLIPNEDLITHRVTNWSYSNDLIRLKLPFGVAYSSDPRQVMALAVEAAESQPRVLNEPKPVCRFMAFGESSLDFELRLWIRDAQAGVVNVRSDVLLGIWDRFKEAGIEIPFPQRDLHIRSGLNIDREAPPQLRDAAE